MHSPAPDGSRFSRLDPEEAGFHEYSLRRLGVRVLYTHEPGANEAGMTGHLIKSLKRVLAHDFSHNLSQVVRRDLHLANSPEPDLSRPARLREAMVTR